LWPCTNGHFSSSVITQVKEIEIEQIKHYAQLDEVINWKEATQKTVGDMQDTIHKLTSCTAALETLFGADSKKVSPHEEGGQASGHSVNTNQQGSESMGKTLDCTLLKGVYLKPIALKT
jgi:hypothetical protein